ncbi:hypothetical protein EKK58_05520 [Candidatus Dependentiae bacterium]|nr:MAG: hypothetical protein EKK58_05520 [Candidatus Dependentiae bacterium]
MGDPPCPEMKAYATWTKGLRRQAKRRLERAELAPEITESALAAVFDGVGSVPEQALVHVQDLLPRCVSENSYDDGRMWALLNYRIYNALYDKFCRDLDPRHQSLEERMALYKDMTTEEIAEMWEHELAILERANRKIECITDLAVETTRLSRAAGITHEQRTAAQFVTIATEAVVRYENASAGKWTRLAIVQHAHRLVALELEKIASAVPIDDELLAKAMRLNETRSETATIDEVWPDGWERVMCSMEAVETEAPGKSFVAL